jgi:hypothetical protein
MPATKGGVAATKTAKGQGGKSALSTDASLPGEIDTAIARQGVPGDAIAGQGTSGVVDTSTVAKETLAVVTPEKSRTVTGSLFLVNPVIEYCELTLSMSDANTKIKSLMKAMKNLKEEDFQFVNASSEAEAREKHSVANKKKVRERQTRQKKSKAAKGSKHDAKVSEETESSLQKKTKCIVIPNTPSMTTKGNIFAPSATQPALLDAKKIADDFKSRGVEFNVLIFRYSEAEVVAYGIEFKINNRIPWGYKPSVFQDCSDYDTSSGANFFADAINQMRAAVIRNTPYGTNEPLVISGPGYSFNSTMLYGYVLKDTTDSEIVDLAKSFLNSCNDMNFRMMYNAAFTTTVNLAKLKQTSDPKSGETWEKLNLAMLKVKAVPTPFLNYCFMDDQIDIVVSQLFPSTAGKSRSMWDPRVRDMVIGDPKCLAAIEIAEEIDEEESSSDSEDGEK